MIEKIKLILNSVRFWSFAIGETGLYLADLANNGWELSRLLTLLSAILITAAGVGTIDRAFENFNKE